MTTKNEDAERTGTIAMLGMLGALVLSLTGACTTDDGDDGAADGGTPQVGTTTPFAEETSGGTQGVDGGVPPGFDEDDDGGDDIEPTATCLAVCETWLTCYPEPDGDVQGCAEDCTWDLQQIDAECAGLLDALNACAAALTCEELAAWDDPNATSYPCPDESDAWDETCEALYGEEDSGGDSGGESGGDSGGDTGGDSGGATSTGG